MLPVTIQIAMAEAKSDVEKAEGGLLEKLKAAMKATHDHWMVTNEDEQFRAAIGAVMVFYGQGSEEFKRLEWEMGNLNRFSAALSASQVGVSVDFGSILDEQEYEPIGLLKLWRDLRAA